MISDAEAEIRAAARTLQEAEAAFLEALQRGRSAGLSWTNLADASGMSRQAVRWRLGSISGEASYVAERRRVATANAQDVEDAKVREVMARQDPAPAGTEHVTKTEAARMLGLARPTLYAWLDAGRVPTVQVGRREMIPVDPESGTIPLRTRSA